MTPKFSLLIGTAVTALVFAAPAAAVFPTLDGGDTGYGSKDSSAGLAAQPDFWNYDQSGQQVANTSPGLAPEDIGTLYSGGTGNETATSIQPAVAAGSGSSSTDWGQAGIGLAMGIVLLIGLLLVMRQTRVRPFAH